MKEPEGFMELLEFLEYHHDDLFLPTRAKILLEEAGIDHDLESLPTVWKKIKIPSTHRKEAEVSCKNVVTATHLAMLVAEHVGADPAEFQGCTCSLCRTEFTMRNISAIRNHLNIQSGGDDQ